MKTPHHRVEHLPITRAVGWATRKNAERPDPIGTSRFSRQVSGPLPSGSAQGVEIRGDLGSNCATSQLDSAPQDEPRPKQESLQSEEVGVVDPHAVVLARRRDGIPEHGRKMSNLPRLPPIRRETRMEPRSESHAEHEALLRQFVAEERRLLRFILQYVPSVPDARDILQESLVTMWAKRAEFDPAREFLPWICGIARHKVREFWRRQARWQAFGDTDLMTVIDSRREELAPELALRAEKLRDCLARLPADQRAQLESYYEGEEPVEAIALRAGRTPEAIYKMLQRMRRTLLDCVERGLRRERITT